MVAHWMSDWNQPHTHTVVDRAYLNAKAEATLT